MRVRVRILKHGYRMMFAKADNDIPSYIHIWIRTHIHTFTYSYVHTYVQIGRTALYMAAENGHADVADVLIKNGADVNVQDTWVRLLHV